MRNIELSGLRAVGVASGSHNIACGVYFQEPVVQAAVTVNNEAADVM
jgi:hypothetical protein